MFSRTSWVTGGASEDVRVLVVCRVDNRVLGRYRIGRPEFDLVLLLQV